MARLALISRLRRQLQSPRQEPPAAVTLRHAPAGAAPWGKAWELQLSFPRQLLKAVILRGKNACRGCPAGAALLGRGCTFLRRCPFRGGSARLIRQRWRQPLRSGCPTARRSPRRSGPAFVPDTAASHVEVRQHALVRAGDVVHQGETLIAAQIQPGQHGAVGPAVDHLAPVGVGGLGVVGDRAVQVLQCAGLGLKASGSSSRKM